MSNYSYSTFSEDKNSSWYKTLAYIEPNSLVLDIGCSSGNFGKTLINQKGCIVDGIELDVADYKLAKKNLRNVYNLNIETDDLSVIKDKYDYVYFGDVIEHLYTPAESLKRVVPLLTDTGSLVFSIPNMAHISVRLMLLQGDFRYGETGLLDKTHLHYYTHNEIQRIFSEAGYAITYLDPVLKDYPKELIAQELQKVGLKLTPEFIDFSRSSEAVVYQYVGAAQPQRSGHKKQESVQLDISSPVDIFQKLLDESKDFYEGQIKSQALHIKKLEKYAKETTALYQQTLETADAKAHEGMRLKNLAISKLSRYKKSR